MYLLLSNMQFFVGKKQFYGVLLSEDYFNKCEFKKLDKRFKKLNTLSFIFVIFSSLILIYKFNKVAFATSFSIFAYLILIFLIYINTHNKVKYIKAKLIYHENNTDLKVSSKSIVDMTFLNKRNVILKKFV